MSDDCEPLEDFFKQALARANQAVFLNLRVAEAGVRDVGRGIARISRDEMASLGIDAGEPVCVAGRKSTYVRVEPADLDSESEGVIQMDGIVRENSQSAIGERVQIERTTCQKARTILLEASEQGASVAGSDFAYLKRVLDGLPVVPGDKLRSPLMSGAYREFRVAETSPNGPVIIDTATSIRFKGEAGGKAVQTVGVTYEDVGGLHKQVQRIREMIELPLRYPELFDHLGIEPPKGVLLYGPPGTGKTLMARALASETSAFFSSISGPEIMGKFYGESEERLRKIFEEAQEHAPSILFIDEIDALAPKREEMATSQQVEKRVVAQLLSLMDGLNNRGQVAVIGATNTPQLIDPALRRPGRFDREIEIGVPDLAGRREILDVHTRGMPLAADVDVDKLADVTHGFVGADLAALCREAAMATLRGIRDDIPLDAETVPFELLSRLEVTMAHFLEALKEVEPSALREVFTEVPDVRWEDVGGLEEARDLLKQIIEWPLQHRELFALSDTAPPKGILLTGKTGTGKTLLARAVASECGVNFISVKGPELLSKWFGESERMLREVFRKARLASPCIVFFDELEAIAGRRGGSGDVVVADRMISQLLTEMDGIEEMRGVVVLAATNRPDLVDPALLRAGRFEVMIELPLPGESARREIFAIHTRSKPLNANVDLEKLAANTEGFAGSDIEAICRRASMDAIRAVVESGGAAPLELTVAHLENALAQVRKGREAAASIQA